MRISQSRLLEATNRLEEAEPLMRRVVEVFLNFTAATGHEYPLLQTAFNNYGGLLKVMGRSEAEVLLGNEGFGGEKWNLAEVTSVHLSTGTQERR